MKVRKGFVSNSSSSSFCIVGVQYSEEDIEKLYDQFTNANLWPERIGDYGPYTVGLSIEKMLDTETLGDFKKRSYETIKKVDNNIMIDDIAIHIDGGFDG